MLNSEGGSFPGAQRNSGNKMAAAVSYGAWEATGVSLGQGSVCSHTPGRTKLATMCPLFRLCRPHWPGRRHRIWKESLPLPPPSSSLHLPNGFPWIYASYFAASKSKESKGERWGGGTRIVSCGWAPNLLSPIHLLPSPANRPSPVLVRSLAVAVHHYCRCVYGGSSKMATGVMHSSMP